MSKSVSMTDIAKIFNVSKVTVSKVLNDKPGVSDTLRKQIKLKAKELGWQPISKERIIKNINLKDSVGVTDSKNKVGSVVVSTEHLNVS